MNKIERIIDVNQNRLVEGLRVLEEYCRFILEEKEMAGELRCLRHFVRKELGQQWLKYRESHNDVGKQVSVSNVLDQKVSLAQVLRGNASRVEESFRVLEEYLKLLGRYELSKKVEQKRFVFYQFEKKLMMPFLIEGLYALTADGTKEEILDQVKTFIKHDVPIVQYRDKKRPYKEIAEIAKVVVETAKGTDTKIIINDYPKIALEVGAHGVHVGQGDITVKEVRKMAPTLMVGVSTHNDRQLMKAIEDQPDYIALGPIFQTTTKINPEHCDGLSFAKKARNLTGLPLVAIGGIDQSNILSVKSLGIDAYAMTASIKEEANLIEIQKMIGDHNVYNSN